MNTAGTACVALTRGDQPEIMPSSDAKMNAAAPDEPPLLTAKSVVLLKVMPVGVPPPVESVDDGIDTTRDCGLPNPSYSVASPVPLSATQTKPLGLKATPHPFCRLASKWSAGTPPSPTRLRT